MAIKIYCLTCRGSYKLETKECPKCKVPLGRTKKFRVCVSVKKKRVSRFYDNLALAREAETAIKADILSGDLDINQKKRLRLLRLLHPISSLARTGKKEPISQAHG